MYRKGDIMEKTVENIKPLIDQGMTVKEISEIFGISMSPMRKWLKNNGLKTHYMEDKRIWTDDALISAINTSYTIIDVIRKLGLAERAGNYDTLRKYIKKLNIDTSHFTGKASGRGGIKTNLSDVMIEGSDYHRGSLKRRLLKDGIIRNKCDICGLEEWNGKKLIMVMDHINGVNNDHREENLRMLCPNCNSQQPTFCSKNNAS
jgi:hypothetical protein